MAEMREKLGCVFVAITVIVVAAVATLAFLQGDGSPMADRALSDSFAAAAQTPADTPVRVADLTDFDWTETLPLLA